MNRPEFFTPLSFDFLWEAGGLGEPPYPLEVTSHGATEAERGLLRQRADNELRARGIRDSGGRLDPEVEDWLTLLARPALSIDAVHIPELRANPVAALAASDGRNGVLAVQDADGIWIRSVYPEGLASAVVDLLPAAGRGTEASVTLPVDEAVRIAPSRTPVTAPAGSTGGSGRRTGLADRQTDSRQAYAQLTGQARIRGGQLAANSRSPLGGKRRSPVLGWFDTSTGRYLSLAKSGADRREWVTVSPADTKTLRTRLGEMLAEISDR
ncbi:ESX secretion-associated protein EspG [Amycolatopsis cihanbeyliensis]|uniref:ESAT-6 protein secretion system EspG family protein n=1 Tax=Amycolatopsis cihanbeyliensis TaxID=1128664 RepID=A0A542DN35_AMYCI|nr:ESX secretion-associated protein EspG [Amycolatopsis cihanbeyliensis]TQJ04506.1 ESAT-6 protein secretion system EspG family protein [Amycolatopsis cihanbeyliensis]